MSTMPNPWMGSATNSPTPGLFQGVGAPSMPSIPGSPGNPGNLPNPFTNVKDATRNAAGINNLVGSDRLAAIPAFLQNLFGFGRAAGDVFGKFADQGSPFYKQKQAEAFTQGTQRNQDEMGQAKERLAASGYGGTPSGATAAMIGGMGAAGAKSLAEQYLEQLFNNENLMMQGAQGLTGVASLFNPSSLFGNISAPGSTQGPSAADQFASIMGSLGLGGKIGPVSVGGGR